jgi:hypothetical protein
MKKIIVQLVLVIGLSLSSMTLLAQGPPPPPGDHGETTNQDAGGSAPIGGGLGILLALGAAYGGRKIYKAWQQHKLEE